MSTERAREILEPDTVKEILWRPIRPGRAGMRRFVDPGHLPEYVRLPK
jgi:hypothetical protein